MNGVSLYVGGALGWRRVRRARSSSKATIATAAIKYGDIANGASTTDTLAVSATVELNWVAEVVSGPGFLRQYVRRCCCGLCCCAAILISYLSSDHIMIDRVHARDFFLRLRLKIWITNVTSNPIWITNVTSTVPHVCCDMVTYNIGSVIIIIYV